MSNYVKLATDAGDQYLSSLAEMQETFLKATTAFTSKLPAAPAVEHVKLAVAQVGYVVGGEAARCVQADLVEHAAEINETTDFRVNTAETGDVRHKRGGDGVAGRTEQAGRTSATQPEFSSLPPVRRKIASTVLEDGC